MSITDFSMKKIYLIILLFCSLHTEFTFSQVEKVIVETYYISDSLDATDTIGGHLEVGSITYRIFVDLAAGVKLRKLYGDQSHPLKFSSTESVFNNIADGLTFGKDFSKSRYGENTVALDSWLTLGQTTRIGAKTYFGVLKDQDVSGSFIGGANNDGGSAAISGGLITNNDPLAFFPVNISDGMDTLNYVPTSWADFGIIDDLSGEDSTIFGSKKRGYEFISTNAALQNSGVSGVNPDSNQVLIAQITTKGQISFDLNIEVEVPSFPNPVIIKYVAALANGEVNSDTLKLSPFLRYPAICGCSDPNYLEYNASFSCGNTDSCRTRIIFGCMDTLACNFDFEANYNLPGLCCYPGNCSDRDIGIVCPTLAFGKIAEQLINLYPNPVNNELTLQFASKMEKSFSYSISNFLGKIIFQKDLGPVSGVITEKINVNELSSGVYIFQLKSVDTSSIAKLIKK